METTVLTHATLELMILEYRSNYDTPEKSSGNCLSVTTEIIENFGSEVDLGIAFACFTGNIEDLDCQYYSNHFALMMDIEAKWLLTLPLGNLTPMLATPQSLPWKNGLTSCPPHGTG